MSHFYGNMRGARGETTRTGTTASGIRAHLRGWDTGVEVRLERTPSGQDQIVLFRTKGSNGDKRGSGRELIARWVDDGKICYWQLPQDACPSCKPEPEPEAKPKEREWPDNIPRSLDAEQARKEG